MHHSDTSSIARHLGKHSFPTIEFQNTTVLEQKKKLQILEALHIRYKHPILDRINFESSPNILKCL